MTIKAEVRLLANQINALVDSQRELINLLNSLYALESRNHNEVLDKIHSIEHVVESKFSRMYIDEVFKLLPGEKV